MKISPKLGLQAFSLYQEFGVERPLAPALFAYVGLQYRYLAPEDFTGEELAFADACLRIGSGLYGLLAPCDGVAPYRLEMGCKLPVGASRDLYAHWGAGRSGSPAGFWCAGGGSSNASPPRRRWPGGGWRDTWSNTG